MFTTNHPLDYICYKHEFGSATGEFFLHLIYATSVTRVSERRQNLSPL